MWFEKECLDCFGFFSTVRVIVWLDIARFNIKYVLIIILHYYY